MSERVDPIRPTNGDRRMWIRRETDRGPEQTLTTVAVEPAQDDHGEAAAAEAAAPPPQPDARERNGFMTFVAQLLGQPGQKRGLRGGPETLEKARAAYLEAEYSGPADRRIARGKITRTEV